ncbi:MAG: hypothetical protein RLZZ519_198 [Bacteroidota bacterium]|jgi:ribosomal protein S18 acetylase RimI-like enzyme
MEIRLVELKDAAQVAIISGHFGHPASTEEMEARISYLLQSTVDWAWVADDQGQIVGWVQATKMMRLERDSFLEITGLVVDEARRSQGIGRELVAKVENFGRQKGLERLVVRSNVKRNRAHGFYLKHGFEEKKQQKVFEKRIFNAGG